MQPEKQGFFKDTQQLAEEYIRERLLLLKLEAAEKSARMASVVFTGIIIGIFMMIVLLLLSAMACFALQEATGSWIYGIGIVSLFYILIMILLIIFRKSFFYKNISDFVVRLFFEKTENDEG
jgi:hypothetical protein